METETLTKRQKAREEVFLLLFEREFHTGKTAEEIVENARLTRGVSDDAYILPTFFGAVEHMDELEAAIEKFAVGWKRNRISAVSIAVMQLAIYEMYYMPDIPLRVSMNEALLLSHRYDDEKAHAFVNGVLNAVMQDAAARRGEE